MIKYIIEILKLQSSLILPGFGSFQVNTKTGKISFNTLLKFNDGTLAKYISQTEGTDQQAAQNQIAKFIREIEAELGKGNSFDMFQFGKFAKNKKGDVEFIQEGTPIQPVEEAKKAAPVKKAAEAEAVPKVEIPKVEIPNVETLKQVQSDIKKVEVPKVEIPKVEIPKVETLKQVQSDIKKVEVPKVEVPKVEIPKVEVPKVEIPKVEVPKVEIPKVEVPKVEIPKLEIPKLDEKQAKNSFTASSESKEKIGETLKQVQSDTQKVEEKIPEISKNIPLAEASKDPAAQEKNKFVPPVVEEKSKDKSHETPKVMAASIKEESKFKKEEPKKESVKEKFKKDKPQKVKNIEIKDKKKKSRWPRLIIILLILGGGAAAGWFYQDDIKSFLFAGVGKNDKDSTNTAHPNDSLVAENPILEEDLTDDSTLIEEPIVEEIVEEPIVEEVIEKPIKENKVVNHTSSSGSYHIIGNAFSSETNADKYVNKMKEKGYSAQNIGKYNGLYLVSLKSFGSKEEAKSNLSSVKADADGAYVFTAK